MDFATLRWCTPLLASIVAITGTLWIGTLFSVSWLSGRARLMADGPEIGRLAVALFRRWTVPSLAASTLTGLAWVAAATFGRPRPHWVYWVMALAVPLIGLHAAVGRRAKGVMLGHADATRGEGVRRFALILSLGAIITLATLRSGFVR
jgi:hypothetical protein